MLLILPGADLYFVLLLSSRARPSNSLCLIRSQQLLYRARPTQTQFLRVLQYISPQSLLHLSHPASRLSSSSASFLVACRMNRFGDATLWCQSPPPPRKKKKRPRDGPRASLHHKGLGVLIFLLQLVGFLVPGWES
ncbi:uncharacterized protein TrAFT101_003617 [Trichoderma asperellum]|uniref:uncharacterized protein n=1 Tax=Trichoderma asperellum TaxID=101201 RepID=UPI003321F281|nr:hypothetical protein TrAFT101_003617 [Trichoderma asperellum]